MKTPRHPQLPHSLPLYARAYTARDLVTLWSALSGPAQDAVVQTAINLATTSITEQDRVYVIREHFHGTSRWPIRKWRRNGRSSDCFTIGTRSVAELEQLIRTAAADPFLADECVLWRTPIHHGHFAIGGRERRIVVVGLTSETHYNGLHGDMRRRLDEMTILPPSDHEAWAGEVCEPAWASTERWLTERE